jgi:hypothetical protein
MSAGYELRVALLQPAFALDILSGGKIDGEGTNTDEPDRYHERST